MPVFIRYWRMEKASESVNEQRTNKQTIEQMYKQKIE